MTTLTTIPVGIGSAGNSAGNAGVVYVDNDDGNLKTVKEDETVIDYGVSDAQAIGPRVDVDNDGNREVPYIASDQKLYIIDDNKQKQQIGDFSSLSAKDSKTKLAVGDWDADGNYDVFFVANQDLYRIDWDERSSSPEHLGLSTEQAGLLVASTDITGDGTRDLVYASTSSALRYVNATGSDVKISSTRWGANPVPAVGEPEDFDGDGDKIGNYSFPIIDGGQEVDLLSIPAAQNDNEADTLVSGAPAKKTAPTGADFTSDGLPDHTYVSTDDSYIKYHEDTDASGTTESGYVKDSNGDKIAADKSVGLATRISSFEDRQSLTSSGKNAGLPDLSSATTNDADGDGTVDEISLTFTEKVDDMTVATGDFSLSSGRIDSVSHPAGTDDKSATLSVSGLTADDTSVTPDVTLTKDSVDDTDGDTGPSSDTTVTASDGAAPVRDTLEYKDTNSDGTTNRIDITYSEDVTASSSESGDYTVGGTDSGSVSKDGTVSVSGSTVRLDVTGPADNTNLDVDLDYTKSAGTADSITDGSNSAASFSGVAVTDSAAPARSGLTYKDTDTDGTVDRVDITYSEDVTASSPESGDYTVGGADSGSVGKDGTVSVSSSTVRLDVTGPADDTNLDIDLDYTKSAGTADSITDGSNPAAKFSGVSITDSAVPTFESVTTNDTDADGKVDRLSVTFTESVESGSVEDADFSVGTANGLSGSLGSSSDDDGDATVNFTVTESSADTDATPTLSYTQSDGSSDKVQDTNGNRMGDTTSAAAADGSAPVPVSGLYNDTDSDGTVDAVNVTFSEPVSYSSYNSGDWTVTANDLSGLSITGKHGVSGATVDLSASADADTTGVGTGTTSTVEYDPSGSGTVSGDSAGTEAVANGNGARSLTDSAAAVITSAATSASAGDEVAVTFSEPIWSNTGQSGDLAKGDFSFTDDSGGSVKVDSVSHTAGSNSSTVTLDGDAEPGSDDIAAASDEIYDGSDNAVRTGTTTVADGTEPAVTGMTGPGDGTYGIGQTLTFDLTYDEAVDVTTSGGTPSVDLTVDGASRSADYVSGSGSKTLTFEYTVQSSDGEGPVKYDTTSVQLNGGDLNDSAGNTAGRDFSGVKPDLTAVDADGTKPSDPAGTTGGNVTASNASTYDVDVSFPAQPESGTVTVELTDGSTTVTGTASADIKKKTTTVSGIDASALNDGTITVTANITDDGDNENSAGLTASSTVTKDTVRPADPTGGIGGNITASNESSYDVDVSFGATPEAGTITVRLSDASGNTVTASASADTASTTTTISGIDASGLADGTDTVDVEAKSVDETGNENPSGFVTLGSTSKDTVEPTVSSFNVTNPSGQDVNVSVETDERLATLTVNVIGAEQANLTLTNFTESGSGPYTYNSTYAGSSDGDYTATLVTAADASENNGSAGESGTVSVSTTNPDRTAPTVSAFSVTNPSVDDVAISFESDEALSSAEAEVNGAETGTITSFDKTITDDGDYRYETTYTAGTVGEYTVELTNADDAAGNNGAAGQSGSSTVDGPTVTGSSFSLDPTEDGLEVSFVADRQLSTVSVSVDGPETATLTSFTETAADGEYTYTATIETEATGNYTATLETATAAGLDGAAGQSDTAEIVDTAFSLAPSATSYLVGVGSNVTLSAGGDTQGVTPIYEWDTDDDTEPEATGETVRVSFDEPGEYAVDVTATADDETLADSVTVTVEDRAPPMARLGTVPATVAEGDTVRFNASGSADTVGIERYAWDFDGDGQTDATGPTVTYTYDTPGEFAPAVTVVDAAGNTDTANGHLTVVGPEAEIDTDRIGYGTVATGSMATERVTVRNGGTAPLMVNATVTNGTIFEAGVGTAVVEPGAAVRIPVSYPPATAGDATGSLTLSTNDSDARTASVSLNGAAVASTLTVVGDQHDAGAVPVGDTGTVSVMLRNDGDRPVSVESLVLRGNDSDQFAVGTASGLPGTVAAGETVTVEIAYEPTAAGEHAATLAVSGNATGDGSPVVVGLTGTGMGPAAAVSVSTVTFGSIGQQSTAQTTVTVLNEGTQPLAVEGATVAGSNATAFGVGDAPETIQPGERAPVTVSFAPVASGAHSAELRLATNTTTSTEPNVTLRGTGAAASVAIDRRSLNFGNVTLGETVTLNVTVKNLVSSETDLRVKNTLLVGEDAESFAVVDERAPFSMAPGERKDIEVAFTPRSAGTKQGQLQILSNGDTPQITVWLSNERTYIVVQEVEERNNTINVDAHNIDTSEPLSVNVSQPVARDETAMFDRLGMAVENRSSFDINITYADQPPSPGAQSYTPVPGTKTLEYVQLNHTVDADATYENTTVTYRVQKGSLPSGTDPDAVELHRWGGDDWNFSATGTLVEETATHYVYRVEVPGFSQFAITGPAENVSATQPSNQSTPAGESESTPTVDAADDGTPTSGMTTTEDGSGGLFAAVVFLLILVFWRRRDDEEDEEGEATGAHQGAARAEEDDAGSDPS